MVHYIDALTNYGDISTLRDITFFTCTGQVPDCIRCHECYFQWYDNITDMANRILDLRVRVDSFVTIYYNGHTLSTIQTELGTLTSVLENANTTINSMTLEESDVARLEASLAQVQLYLQCVNTSKKNM